MSVRSSGTVPNHVYAQQLRQDIAAARQAEAGASELTFEQLTEVEKSAATIGVSPEAWRPIGWMNEAHYGELLKNNVLAGRLTQQIEAYKVVAAQGP